MIDKEHELPVTKQCHILDLCRSSVYYMPTPVSDKDRELMTKFIWKNLILVQEV